MILVQNGYTKTIPLSAGKVALVDDADFEFLNQWKWTYQSGYACRNRAVAKGIRAHVRMHDILVDVPLDAEVDHIDGNGLNNQRNNLRICSHAENCRNQKLRKDSRTGFKGVDFHRKTGKYRARITRFYKVHHLGFFETIDEAREAYNNAAVKLHGAFARPNTL